MKKAIFSFAILAVAAMIASCGQKAQQNAEIQDSTAVVGEQTEEAVLATTIDQASYSLGLPEGWAIMSQDDMECFVYKGNAAKPSEAINGTFLSLKIGPSEGKTLDNTIEEMVKEMGVKLLDDVTIGGTTYKQCSYTEDDVESRILMAGTDKMVSIMMARTTPDDADVQAIVNSLKLK